MAIRNILGALGGLLNRRPDEEDPLAGLSPEALAGYYGARSRGRANDRLNPSDLDLTGPLTGGGQMSVQGAIDAAQRSSEKQRSQRKRLDDERMAQKLSERQREEDRRIDSKRKFDESRRDLARNKSREEQEARMSRQNLTDAQSGARSDIQDRESRDRILEGIMQGRAEVQAQEQADQDLINENEQNFLQNQQERFLGKEPERYSRMLANQRLDKNIEDIRAKDLLRKRTERSDQLKAEGLSRKPQIGSFDLDVNQQLNQQFPPTPEEAVEEELKKTSPTASVEPPVEPPVEPATNEDFSFLENPENVFQDTSDMKVEEEYDLQQAPVRVREGAVSPATGSKLRGTMSEYETEDELEQRLREEKDLERKQDALDFYNKSKGSRLFDLPSSYHENLQKEVDARTETPTERTPTFFEEGPEIKITSSEELGDSFDEDQTSGITNFRGNKDVPFGDISGRNDPSVLSAETYYDSLGPSNDPGELGSYRTLGGTPRTVTDVTAPDMETPVAEEEKEQSFFGKIGQLVKDNPEVAAQIAQLGGGLISGAAQGKAQRKADAETQRRLGRANMIGAFTGDTPAVQAATADPSGFFSLDTLGKAVSGGGAIAQDELTRRTAEADKERSTSFAEEMKRADLTLNRDKLDLDKDALDSLNTYRERQGNLTAQEQANIRDYREKSINLRQQELTREEQRYQAGLLAQAAANSGAQFEQVRNGVKDINDNTKLYQNGAYLDPTNGMKKLYGDMGVLFDNFENDMNPANAIAIINTYQRMFDPATVREGDVDLMKKSQGEFRQLAQALARNLGEGGPLRRSTIEEMKKITDDIHKLHSLKANDDVNRYLDVGYDPVTQKTLRTYYEGLLQVPTLESGKNTLVADLKGQEITLGEE